MLHMVPAPKAQLHLAQSHSLGFSVLFFDKSDAATPT